MSHAESVRRALAAFKDAYRLAVARAVRGEADTPEGETAVVEAEATLWRAATALDGEHDRLRVALLAFLTDQESMNEPYRNEALCEDARAALGLAGEGA